MEPLVILQGLARNWKVAHIPLDCASGGYQWAHVLKVAEKRYVLVSCF